jgi:WD40 repeat protein
LPARPQSQGTLAFSPDGKVLAPGGNNGEITFWDWDAGKATDALGNLGRAVSQIAFSPDGRSLAFRVAFGETKL